MKLRLYIQAAAYSTIVLCAPMTSAADVDYSRAEQRIRDLELRINSLESAGNEVNLAAYSGCDSSGGDCCGSSRSSSCSNRRSSWLRPCCPISQFDTEFLLFAVSSSEASANDSQNDFNAGLRMTYSRVNQQGQIFRVRYFNFGSTLEGGSDRIEMETIDTEIGRRFTLGGGLRGEFTGGVRYASFEDRGDFSYDTTFGPLVSLQLRGRKFLRGTSFANLRHSWQFGDDDRNGVDVPGTFNISEVQFGLEWRRASRLGTMVFRTALEAQSWSEVLDEGSGDLGLYGTSSSFGLAF